MSTFENWWDKDGSKMTPICNDDHEEHAKRVAEMAFAVSEDFYQSVVLRILQDLSDIPAESFEFDLGEAETVFYDYLPLRDVYEVIAKYKGLAT